ncbi:MAG: hypothetical protein HYY06_01140 [Deltaproteobacteria bacterium]|nr:hypothetical protein [Deltaproteobacteria bacterium]
MLHRNPHWSALLLGTALLGGCDSDDGATSRDAQPPDDGGGSGDGGGVDDGGRDGGSAGLPEEPVFSGTFEEPDRRWLRDLDLPPGPDGVGYSMFEMPIGTMILDPDDRGPITAAGECAALILACWDPDLRNYAGCLQNVRQCPDDRPWEGDRPFCCPTACEPRYQDLRRQGLDAAHALTAAIWDDPSCMPAMESGQ